MWNDDRSVLRYRLYRVVGAMLIPVEVSPGFYEIGSEDVPNASPRHRRRIGEAFWIDSAPLTWAHYEAFVAAGGYARDELWVDGEGCSEIRPKSVDSRVRTLISDSREFRQSCRVAATLARGCPLTGVSWFEAAAICRFYGARLPFEVEWEVAMQGARSVFADLKDSQLFDCPISQWGCSLLLGLLQEWTVDAFNAKYWRADADRRGVPWSPTTSVRDVTVRGAAPQDLHRHISSRKGHEPKSSHPFRGFRRVWDSCPSADIASPAWRSQT